MGRLPHCHLGGSSVKSKLWTEHTYLFTTKRRNPADGVPAITQPDPAKVFRRRLIETINEKKEMDRRLADPWD